MNINPLNNWVVKSYDFVYKLYVDKSLHSGVEQRLPEGILYDDDPTKLDIDKIKELLEQDNDNLYLVYQVNDLIHIVITSLTIIINADSPIKAGTSLCIDFGEDGIFQEEKEDGDTWQPVSSYSFEIH